MNAQIPQPWEEVYREAVLETDQGKLISKIDAASVILKQRLAELGSSSGSGRSEEKQRLANALLTLDMIRRIELGIPV
ncbi:MAG: hypothetical protein ABR880_10190 [Candidatus Sulfotelmatobacter sp.]|jgi:hypothetical protein